MTNLELWDLGYNDGAGINTPMLLDDPDYVKGYSAGVSSLIKEAVTPEYKFYQHAGKTN